MAVADTLPLQEAEARITRQMCRLGDTTFEAADIMRFGSVSRTVSPHWALRAGLFILGFLALSSAVRGIMTSYWVAAVVSTVMAVPLFLLASLKSTHALTVELRDGQRVEYVGASDHIKRVEAAIGMATMTETTGQPDATSS